MSEMFDRRDLRGYQAWCADKIVELPAFFLTIDMSMGKTAIVLTAIRDLFRHGQIKHALIIAPLRVAEETWPTEIEKWSHLNHLTYAVATGMPTQRRRAINKRAQVTMINRENLPWLWRLLRERKKPWIWDFVAWDESSALKEWKKRTSGTLKNPHKHNLTRFGAMAQARQHVKRMVLMTGTPSPNGVKDLGGQAYILDQGERLGSEKTAFLQRWFDHDEYSRQYTPRPGAQDAIMGRLKDVMVSLSAEDYLDLPEIITHDIKVKLPPKILAQYRQFERDSYSEAYDVEAVSAGVLTNKLLQFANGALYRGREDLERKSPPTIEHVHNLKLDALDSVIAEAAGQPVMVGYSYKFDLLKIKKRYPKAVILSEEKDAVKRWNKGEIDILLTHPASAGHGLNLQHGGHILCWYGFTWSLELYLQLNMRLPRPGQKSPFVIVHRIIAEGTADETVLEVMGTRGVTQKQVTDAVRVRLEGHVDDVDTGRLQTVARRSPIYEHDEPRRRHRELGTDDGARDLVRRLYGSAR